MSLSLWKVGKCGPDSVLGIFGVSSLGGYVKLRVLVLLKQIYEEAFSYNHSP